MNELADCHRSFVVVGKYTISDKIQITTCLVLTFRQVFITGDSCTNLLTDMEKVQWKPPWLSMQQNYAHHRLQMMHAATIIKFMGSLLCSAEKSQSSLGSWWLQEWLEGKPHFKRWGMSCTGTMDGLLSWAAGPMDGLPSWVTDGLPRPSLDRSRRDKIQRMDA
jgi:hypothetical protein